MRVQVDHLDDGLHRQCLQRTVQLAGQPRTAQPWLHEQPHHFHHLEAAVLELLKTVVVGQITNGGDDPAFITDQQKLPPALEINLFEIQQVRRSAGTTELWEQLGASLHEEGFELGNVGPGGGLNVGLWMRGQLMRLVLMPILSARVR